MPSIPSIPHLTPCTDSDYDIISSHLQRRVRGVVGVASRCVCGAPQVVATAPRLENGTPFPTTFYLTYPYLVKALSRLEAAKKMADYQAELSKDLELSQRYYDAHTLYLRQRQAVGTLVGLENVEEIEFMSAGGMPNRVKCLHALVGHTLSSLPGVNPIGERALADITPAWDDSQCWCGRDEPETIQL
ncbi:MAG: DUF501 domain-containing protein [Actinomycetaceae bacterium]|nr:DUF501 domain-containing protein [Actinomycetaceae bacterium]